jgi:hypothetical protein
MGRDPALTRSSQSQAAGTARAACPSFEGCREALELRHCHQKSTDRSGPGESNSLVALMIRSASRLILVLIAAAAIAISAGGFSWDGTPDNFGWGTPDTAIVDGPSVDSSGTATVDGFSWDEGIASTAAAG